MFVQNIFQIHIGRPLEYDEVQFFAQLDRLKIAATMEDQEDIRKLGKVTVHDVPASIREQYESVDDFATDYWDGNILLKEGRVFKGWCCYH